MTVKYCTARFIDTNEDCRSVDFSCMFCSTRVFELTTSTNGAEQVGNTLTLGMLVVANGRPLSTDHS